MAKPPKKQPPAEPAIYDETLVGYARVSTAEQSMDMQVAALIRAGVNPDHIHKETVSGVSAKRPGRDLALKDCRRGDTLVAWKLDRVGRSAVDMHNFMAELERRGVAFRSLTESIDTKTAFGKLYLALLAAFAQFERDVIQERTKAGVARARERGQEFGQPPKVTEKNHRAIEKRIHEGVALDQVAKEFEMSLSCLRMWYYGDILETVRKSGPLKQRPPRKA